MFVSEVDVRFLGTWQVNASGLPGCYGLRLTADSRGRDKLLADLLFWAPGRRGCSTRSSDVGIAPLTIAEDAPSSIRLATVLKTTDGQDEAISLDIRVTSDGASGELVINGSEFDVTLDPVPTDDNLGNSVPSWMPA